MMHRQPITNNLFTRAIQPPEAVSDWMTIAVQQQSQQQEQQQEQQPHVKPFRLEISLRQVLNTMRYNNNIITIRGTTFRVTRTFLERVSNYHQGLYIYDDRNDSVVILHSDRMHGWEPVVKAEIFFEILRFEAFRIVLLTDKNVAEVLIMANYLRISELEGKCIDYITSKATPECICQLLEFSQDYRLADLTEQCIRYFKLNLLEISLQPGFMDIKPTFLKLILDSDDLIIRFPGEWEAMTSEDRETAIFYIVIKYVIANSLDDDPMGEDLVRSVRLLDIRPSRVIQVIEECVFFSTNEGIMRLVELGTTLWTQQQALDGAQIPESWRRRRIFARWQRHHGTSVPRSIPLSKLNEFEISQVTIAIGQFGGLCFINMITVKYRHHITKTLCYTDTVGVDNFEQEQDTVRLGNEEHIIKCRYVIDRAGVISSLMFETDAANTYGPYGAPDVGHGQVVEEGSNAPTTFLYRMRNGVKQCPVVNKYICSIDLEWITFS